MVYLFFLYARLCNIISVNISILKLYTSYYIIINNKHKESEFMGLFNFGKKNNNIKPNNDVEQWDNFCKLDESFKNDEKLKPVYYLKLYEKKMIYTNSEIKNKAKSDIIRAITDSLKSENNSTVRCLIDYLINKYEILDNERLIDIINNLDKDSLETIANSYSFLSYVQMREQIKNITNNDINELVRPLLNVLNNKEIDCNLFISKYAKQLRDYIYNVYDIMMNEKFESYKFNSNKTNIYFYGNKLVVVFDEDEENLNFGFKESNAVHIEKIKRLLKINNELFTKNYKEIIWNDEIPKHIENEFYNDKVSEFSEKRFQAEKTYYIFKHEKYGDIEFYYKEDGIEIKCKALNPEMVEIIGIEDTFENEDIIQLYIKAIEKIIEVKGKILETLYNYTLQTCKLWEEKDENGNDISRDYIVNHFSRIRISIWPQAENKKEGYSEDNTSISFAGDLYDEDGAEMLGGHEIIVNTVNGENISCKLNG